eukprot:11167354-Lingulodinium_polyedra.AAC.1
MARWAATALLLACWGHLHRPQRRTPRGHDLALGCLGPGHFLRRAGPPRLGQPVWRPAAHR